MNAQNRRSRRSAWTAAVVAVLVTGSVGMLRPPAAAAAPPQFSHVLAVPEGMALRIYFDYTGSITPIVTVGTGDDVFATQVRQRIGTQINPGRYYAYLQGLQPGTKYFYRIDNWVGTYQSRMGTLRRAVSVTFTDVHILDDGDAWPKGCGEFYFTVHVRNQTQWVTQEPCLDSGDWYHFGPHELPGFGEYSWANFPSDDLYFDVWALDRDEWNIAGCGGSQSATCGDIAWGYSHFGVRDAGTTMRPYLAKWQMGHVSAIFWAKVTVAYVK